VSDILSDLVNALRGELGQSYSSVSNIVETQGKLLAKQAAHIAKSRATGSLRDDDELYLFYLESLKDNTLAVAKAVVMVTALTIEKAWNAIAGALWGGIRSILSGAGVPASLLPETPPINL
jgi:hypothetical protein